MGHLRPRPKHLANKLLQIRLSLGLSQGEMVKRLRVQDLIHYTNISKYELDKNEPPLAILLAYGRLAGIPVEQIIDDDFALPETLTPPPELIESRKDKQRIMVFPVQRQQRLGQKLLQIRKWLKLSQPEMVERLGLQTDFTLISMYEHNRRQPSLKILLAYARIAGIPLEQIVDDDLELQLSDGTPLNADAATADMQR
jgi:transcriptional regulator with XRE-family HTH domain